MVYTDIIQSEMISHTDVLAYIWYLEHFYEWLFLYQLCRHWKKELIYVHTHTQAQAHTNTHI